MRVQLTGAVTRELRTALVAALDARGHTEVTYTEQADALVFVSSPAVYPTELQTGPGESWSHIPGQPVQRIPGSRALAESDARLLEAPADRLILRPFTMYGAPDSVAPSAVDQLIAAVVRRADPLLIPGTGWQVRDFIHVDDVVGGCLAALEQGHRGPLNLCTGVGTTWLQFAVTLAAAAGYDYEPWLQYDERPCGPDYQVGDPSMLARLYRPAIDLDEGIDRVLHPTRPRWTRRVAR